MPENINWNGVLQSIIDTWLPLFGWIIVIIIVVMVIKAINKRKKN